MLSRLFKPLALPPQLQWKSAHEPTLMEWTIRARSYNALAANIACVIFSMVLFLFLYAMNGDDDVDFSLVIIYIVGTVFSWVMFHPRMNTAYRLTASGIEYCEWKDFPKWMLTFLNWFAGISVVICLWLASMNPAFLLGALVGPGAMGLMYWAMANSESYQASQTEYHHHHIKWADVTQLAIATNRAVVDLRFYIPGEGDPYPIVGSLNVFCRRKEKQKVAELIKPYLLQGIPFLVTKVNVPMSTY